MLWFITTGTFLWRKKCSTIQSCIFPKWLLTKSILWLYYENAPLLKNALFFFCQSVLQTSEMVFLLLLGLCISSKLTTGFLAQAHVCNDSIYFGQPSVIVYIVNIIVNDTKIIIFQQCFLSFLCKSGRKTDKAKLYIQSTINTDYFLWQKNTV